METEFSIQCPYCGEQIWMEFYSGDGSSQDMIVDCEVCCHPIHYKVTFNRDGEASITVEQA